MPRVLVVGGQSQIGSALVAALPERGWSVTSTSRQRNAAVANKCFQLDLSISPSAWPAFPSVDAAVLCAAVTSQQVCESNPAASEVVNVDHTIALAKKLSESGTFVLLLSTAVVFDGSRSHRTHDELTNPSNVYGRHKAAAEKAVLAGGTAAVLRLSKVIGPNMPLLKKWMSNLQASKPIIAFSDARFAPIAMTFVVKLIDNILREKRVGVFHASGDRDLPYSSFATMLCDALDVPHSLRTVASSDGKAGVGHTTLDMSIERCLFGVERPSSESAILETLHAFV